MSVSCPLCRQLEDAKAGRAGLHIADLKRTSVFLSENQGSGGALRGWCVLVLRQHVEHLSDLSLDDQMSLFREVALVAAAVRARFSPSRINYECLGNQVGHVHWHIIPRYGRDPDPTTAVWGFPADFLKGESNAAQHADTIALLRASLGK
jgi:diadenosine tetraphosphate (Ap4A) HIT family hydrolase